MIQLDRFSRKNNAFSGEQELKFLVPASRTCGLAQWLGMVARPHRQHASSRICSIYFDTRERVSFHEKEASDYRKTKYRLRWYADEKGAPLPTPAHLEVKEKHGSVRRKYRVPLEVPAAELAVMPLESAGFRGIFLKNHRGELPMPERELLPVLELQYRRQRYDHAVFLDTFCLDSEIRCLRTHPEHLPSAQGQALPHDVFEQKGASQHPTPVLQALPRFGARRAAISKFYLAIAQLSPAFATS